MSEPAETASAAELPADAYGALRVPGFRRYVLGNFLAQLGSQMQTAAVGWEIYQRTHRLIDLGYVGLIQVIPVVLLALPAGQVVDRYDRRRVIQVAQAALVLASLGLAFVSWTQAPVLWIYACLLMTGIARAFQQPAKAALVPLLVPREVFTNAVTWSTSTFQLATIVGPSLGGQMIGWWHSAYWVYLIDASLTSTFFGLLMFVGHRPQTASRERLGMRSLVVGLGYVWRAKLILGAISLDMFAVLLGGATALLPVFATDILHADARGYGLLRAAPGIGALVMSYCIARGLMSGWMQRAGRTLLWSVAGFGLATIVFGISRSFWLSWVMLLASGALDMISVIIRHTLVQLWTPDEMRGRVSAVNGMFISVSNELGAFRSGLVAQIFATAASPALGPTVAVVTGGLGTVAVVLVTAWLFPEVRRYGRLGEGGSQR